VKECDKKTQPKILLAALAEHEGSNVIVYASTIKTVEATVDFLRSKKIHAIPYHGQMDNSLRQRNQELWMSEEVPVLVGTLAFGLGINKPSVRAVIHLALPKSIEQYYQEAGRAGRDGLPADCALLWQRKDAGLLAHFVQQLENPRERENAWERYHIMRRYVESEECRHHQICVHFGETPKWERCDMCDVCKSIPAWFSDKARLMVTDSTVPVPVPVRKLAVEGDQDLIAHMKKWRRELAQQRGIPAFMVMHDSTLLDLCRREPRDVSELLHVTGIGERKAETYGTEILKALAEFRNR
jgi:ATP-dependent DNA helicase RecQ